jgi:hypothetical protein
MPCHRTCARRACVCPPSSAVDSTWSAGRARTFAATRACGRADRRRRSTPRASWRREGTARARASAMGAGASAVAAGKLGLRLRPLLAATAVLAVAAVVYVLVLSLIVAAALSRLSTVHNSAAEYSVCAAVLRSRPSFGRAVLTSCGCCVPLRRWCTGGCRIFSRGAAAPSPAPPSRSARHASTKPFPPRRRPQRCRGCSARFASRTCGRATSSGVSSAGTSSTSHVLTGG